MDARNTSLKTVQNIDFLLQKLIPHEISYFKGGGSLHFNNTCCQIATEKGHTKNRWSWDSLIAPHRNTALVRKKSSRALSVPCSQFSMKRKPLNHCPPRDIVLETIPTNTCQITSTLGDLNASQEDLEKYSPFWVRIQTTLSSLST